MALSYANIFLSRFETNALTHASHKLNIWWFHIDDILLISTHSVRFHNLPQWHPPHHEFTCYLSFASIAILGVNVSIINGKIITDLHTKPTDKPYLLHSLCHLLHTKRDTSFSLALRLRPICSTDDSSFHKRTYDISF